MRVEYHPAVEHELREIRNYYEERSPGLGSAFVDEFERQILRLAAAPERWMVVENDNRRCLMRRFPYIVYFRQVATDRIRIIAVKHQRRHPRYGRATARSLIFRASLGTHRCARTALSDARTETK